MRRFEIARVFVSAGSDWFFIRHSGHQLLVTGLDGLRLWSATAFYGATAEPRIVFLPTQREAPRLLLPIKSKIPNLSICGYAQSARGYHGITGLNEFRRCKQDL